MLCIKYKIDAEKVRGARSGFPHPGTNQKVTLGQNSLFRTRNKINSDMNRMAVTHVKV